MADQSNLDAKYFISHEIYNCPYCNRRNVVCTICFAFVFDWSNTRECWAYNVECSSCEKRSLHFSFQPLHSEIAGFYQGVYHSFMFADDKDLDGKIFHSIPTSFFVIDERIPKILRELMSEAEGCLKMNFITGASACTRKAIYELLKLQNAEGEYYSDKIKSLKMKFTNVDPLMFDTLDQIKDMTSDKVHEQSWEDLDSQHIRLFLEVLKNILHEVYVVPEERKKRSGFIQSFHQAVAKEKKT